MSPRFLRSHLCARVRLFSEFGTGEPTRIADNGDNEADNAVMMMNAKSA
jgi:hypothetical protein